jgi:hypothetical protein
LTGTTLPAFTGWRRSHPKARWLTVAWGGTLAECWDALLLATVGSSGESIVLPAGRHPDERTPYRRGVR